MNLKRETVQRLFDALVGSMDFGSGFLETDDVIALREVAEALGVDPAVATPAEFVTSFPHAYSPEPDFYYGSACRPPGVGWIRLCTKPESDPIHRI